MLRSVYRTLEVVCIGLYKVHFRVLGRVIRRVYSRVLCSIELEFLYALYKFCRCFWTKVLLRRRTMKKLLFRVFGERVIW